MTRPLLVALLLSVAACDNVGRAFDPNVDPGGSEPTTGESAIQVVPIGGEVRDGRPKVKTAVPRDGGWPGTVPIVIEFNESVNEASIAPTTPSGTDGRIVLRVRGTTQVLPCLYDFLAGGRLLVMRPVTELSNAQNPTYEVVLLPDARDVDGVRFKVDGDEEVLTSFQVNQDSSFVDGRILAVCPRDNKGDVAREASYIVVFDRPADVTSVDPTSNFVLRQNGSAVPGTVDAPVRIVGQSDGRVVRFTPDAPLGAGLRYEFFVMDTIAFGSSGKLDYSGRTPFAVFDTVGPQAPSEIHIANPTPGFPDKINAQNLGGIALLVRTPVDSQAGDTVLARIYGGDADTSTAGDLAFFEATAPVPAAGSQDVVVSFAGKLGTAASPRLDEGALVLCAQMLRGSQQSSFVQNDAEAEPLFDATPPTLVAVGPPASVSGSDVYTDLEQLTLYGVASEELGEATLTDGVNPIVGMFASDDTGAFVLDPLPLGRLSAPRPYTLTLADRAGNLIATPVSGNIVQRGVLTGTTSGTLVVEAYDEATLRPVVGATVLVDPGMPSLPASGQRIGVTGSDGLATFTGLSTTQHSVTIVADGYDLMSFLGTTAERVSLPLRPIGGSTATFSGSVLFQATVGQTVVVGNNALEDPRLLGVATTVADPGAIPATAILPNRPQVVTAFAGVFEPPVAPAFASHGYQMLGPTMTTAEPPAAPAAPGGTSTVDLALLPATGTTLDLTSYSVDFAAANGLDTASLVGGAPIARVTVSLDGFVGQALAGVGVATTTGATSWSVLPTYGVPLFAGLAVYHPLLWSVLEARDAGGRISRHRALVLFGSLINAVAAPGIPVIAPPGGPSTGSPLVTFDDVLDPAPVPGGVALSEVRAEDPAGRRWTLLVADTDGLGGTVSVQFPDLSGSPATGLVSGDWEVFVEARVLLSLTSATPNALALADRFRQEATYARSAAVTFTVP